MTDPTRSCRICGYDVETNLQEHHIVPRRFGGSDDPENLITLCPTCHQAVEKMHDKRFYQSLGVYRTVEDHGDDTDPIIEHVRNVIEYVVRSYSSRNGRLSDTGREFIQVILSEFGLTGQFCFSCETFYNTRFETDDECPNCKGMGFETTAPSPVIE